MDVTRFKKVTSVLGGLALAIAVSAPANAAWTNVPIPPQYASNIASLRLCKTEVPAPVAGSMWQVRSELTRITSNVTSNTIIVRRFSGSQSTFIGLYPSISWDSTNTARTTAYGFTTLDDRYFPVVSFYGTAPFYFPGMTPAEIANC